MGILHIFNPEHDIALASNLSNFTAPHAGRQLRGDLGYLPSLWSNPGDAVYVDHVEYASRAWSRLSKRIHATLGINVPSDIRFIQAKTNERQFDGITAIDPWGWDKALVATLHRQGVSPELLPNDAYLDNVRQQSHRRAASRLLPLLRMEGTVGESFECTSVDEVRSLLLRYGHIVMKAPWSSSGRGVRFLAIDSKQLSVDNWISNVVKLQGSIMVEPYYNKVKDFGMEFCQTEQGIHYLGLSLFHTVNGAYTGNIIATENWKRDYLSRYISVELLDSVKEKIINLLRLGDYRGCFGVDMMVCAGSLLHPCVEINLRRTMGHVALALSPTDDDIVKVMRISLTDHYRLSLTSMR
jgi:hypothetical protein